MKENDTACLDIKSIKTILSLSNLKTFEGYVEVDLDIVRTRSRDKIKTLLIKNVEITGRKVEFEVHKILILQQK